MYPYIRLAANIELYDFQVLEKNASATSIKLTWKQVDSPPQLFTHGKTVVYENTAYFSCDYDVYSFTLPDNKWTKLQSCRYRDFSMVNVDGKLTTIGGYDGSSVTNTLLSIVPGHSLEWNEILPPMPTK